MKRPGEQKRFRKMWRMPQQLHWMENVDLHETKIHKHCSCAELLCFVLLWVLYQCLQYGAENACKFKDASRLFLTMHNQSSLL